MGQTRINQLQDAINQFTALTGRRVNSALLATTLKEGEYKADLVPETPPVDSDKDDLKIPWFLDRRQKGEGEDKPKPESDAEQGSDRPESEHHDEPEHSEGDKSDHKVVTKEQVIEALNWIQDRGFVRSDTKKIAINSNQYTFVHHQHGPMRLRVERLNEGYRLVGASLLREFEVPPGGPAQMSTMALGQQDGDVEMPLAERVQNDLIDQFEQADYSVRITVDPYRGTGISVTATPIRGMMSSYDLDTHKDMVESVILRTVREKFPKLRPVSRPGVTGWNDTGDRSILRLLYQSTEDGSSHSRGPLRATVPPPRRPTSVSEVDELGDLPGGTSMVRNPGGTYSIPFENLKKDFQTTYRLYQENPEAKLGSGWAQTSAYEWLRSIVGRLKNVHKLGGNEVKNLVDQWKNEAVPNPIHPDPTADMLRPDQTGTESNLNTKRANAPVRLVVGKLYAVHDASGQDQRAQGHKVKFLGYKLSKTRSGENYNFARVGVVDENGNVVSGAYGDFTVSPENLIVAPFTRAR